MAWTTFGFGGVYASALGVPAVICLGLAAAYRPWTYRDAPLPALHAWLAVYVAAIGVQLLPMPPALTDVISPALRPTMAQLALALPPWLPPSIDEP